MVLFFFQVGHCLWLSAAGHVVGHNAAAAVLLHLAEIPQHSAFFKAKAYEHPVNVQAGLYLRGLWESLQNLTEPRAGVDGFGERLSTSLHHPLLSQGPRLLSGCGLQMRVCLHSGCPGLQTSPDHSLPLLLATLSLKLTSCCNVLPRFPLPATASWRNNWSLLDFS